MRQLPVPRRRLSPENINCHRWVPGPGNPREHWIWIVPCPPGRGDIHIQCSRGFPGPGTQRWQLIFSGLNRLRGTGNCRMHQMHKVAASLSHGVSDSVASASLKVTFFPRRLRGEIASGVGSATVSLPASLKLPQSGKVIATRHERVRTHEEIAVDAVFAARRTAASSRQAKRSPQERRYLQYLCTSLATA